MMNKDDIKFKYHLGLWKTLPGYPTSEDILYEITSYVEKNMKSNEFTEQTLNSVWPKGKHELADQRIGELITEGLISKEEKSGKTVYKL